MMNPFDDENSEPNYWLSCLLISPEAMCKQVRGEQEVLYVSEPGKELSNGDSGDSGKI